MTTILAHHATKRELAEPVIPSWAGSANASASTANRNGGVALSTASDPRLTPAVRSSLPSAVRSHMALHEPRDCVECGEPFVPATRRHTYCSARCRYRVRDRRRFLPWGTPRLATCASCGDEFGYLSSTRPRIYCETCKGRRPDER
jgi:hypothetical protein